MRVALVAVLDLLTASALWLAGEQHRKNCLSSGRAGCSVLPWDSGDRAQSGPPDARGCEQVDLINEYDGVQGDTVEVPPECR
jgi:hypothetical protein